MPSTSNLYTDVFASIRVHLRPTLLCICGLVVIILWLLQWTPYLNVANDSGRYMVLGESLARTGDLRLLNDVRQPLDTLYPPGFPAIIAFWMRALGRDAMGVILPVKLTLLALLLGILPLLYTLLERARLPRRYIAAGMLIAAACPALISYANEVMSEMPLVFLCLASVGLAERKGEKEKRRKGEWEEIQEGQEPSTLNSQLSTKFSFSPFLLFSFSCLSASAAFLVRTSGIALLLAQIVWFWKRYGWKWGMGALLVTLVVVGGWLKRNSHIVKAHPEIRYSSYVDQFTLKNPMQADSGRIPLNARGILSRMKFGLPTYIGLIPRTPLYMMAPPRTGWLAMFYVIAVPLTLLMFVGIRGAWKRGLKLSVGFSLLFWFVAAMWPWQNARFLVPLIPFMILFLMLGVWAASEWLRKRSNAQSVQIVQVIGAAALLIYFANVHWRVIRQEHRPTLLGYAFGRNRDEAGFYAACAWLRQNSNPREIAMGKPQYLLHLYAGNLTAQLEPTTSARAQEKAYIVPQHVHYLLQDAWYWGVPSSRQIFANYLSAYGDKWELAWTDPNGSGVRIWKRKESEEEKQTAKHAK